MCPPAVARSRPEVDLRAETESWVAEMDGRGVRRTGDRLRPVADGTTVRVRDIGLMAPTGFVTNPAALSTADMLRRVTLVAYRTRELQLAWPDAGFATGERAIWEDDEAWQPTRRALELALTSYDWAEAFTAMNLVLLPTLDDVLLRQLGELAKAGGDQLTWLLTSFLQRDVDRRERWSGALASFAINANAANAAVLQGWVDRWVPRADEAAHALGTLLSTLPEHGRQAGDVAAKAAAARSRLLAGAGLG